MKPLITYGLMLLLITVAGSLAIAKVQHQPITFQEIPQ